MRKNLAIVLGYLLTILFLLGAHALKSQYELRRDLHTLAGHAKQTSAGHVASNDDRGQQVEQAILEAEANYRTSVTLNVILLTLSLVGVPLALLLDASIRRPSQRLRASVERLAAGNLDGLVPHTDFSNEVGNMARAIQILQSKERATADQHWIKSNVAEITAMIQPAHDFGEFAQVLLSNLARLTQTKVGLLYVMVPNSTQLFLAGSYGAQTVDSSRQNFVLGDGLVGQCAQVKTPIRLEQPPSDYLRIGSAVGSAAPHSIELLPLLHCDNVVGVLELAAFEALGDREREFLGSLLPVVALALEVLAGQLQTQRTEAWFRSVIGSAPEGLIVVDRSGLVLLANSRAEEIFSYAPGEFEGIPVARLFPDGVASETQNIQLRGAGKNGDSVPVEISVSTLTDPAGHPCSCLAVRDIRARLQLDEELRRSKFLAETALDLSRSGYWHLTLDGSEDFVSSERAAAIFGEEPRPDGWRYNLEREWMARVEEGDPEAAAITRESFAAAVEGRSELFDATYAYRRPIDGRIVWLRDVATVSRDENGKALAIYGVVQDITGQREELRREEERQQSNRTAQFFESIKTAMSNSRSDRPPG